MFHLDGLEPGPIADDVIPLGPRRFDGPIFEPLAEPVVTVIRGGDVALGASSTHVALDVPQDLATFYQGTAGQAEGAHADHVAAGSQSEAGVLIDAGVGVDVYRAAVLPHLPPPSTGVSFNLVPAPQPPPELVGNRPDIDVPDVPGV